MNGARFEKGACIAWRVDCDRGYRDAMGASWVVVPLERSRGRGVVSHVLRQEAIQVDTFIGDTFSLVPEVRLEPIPEGKLRVRSTLELVIQRLGDDLPQRVASLAEVRYGAVVRAGPLLFAPLTREQAKKLRTGELDLPLVGGGMESEAVWESLSGADEALLRAAAKARPSRIPLVIAIALIIAVLCSMVTFALWPRPNPRSVLVIVQGASSENEDDLERVVRERLVDVGLSPTRLKNGFDVDQASTRESILHAMEWHRSSAAVVFDIDAQRVRPGLESNRALYQVRVSAQATVPGRLDPGALHTVEFADEETSGENAVQHLGFDGVQLLTHAILSELLASMDVSTVYSSIFSPGSRPLERAHRGALKNLAAWRYTTDAAQQSCERARAALDESLSGGSNPLTGACGEEFPIGLTDNGTAVVVQVETVQPYSTFSAASRVVGAQIPDRIELLPLDGRPRKTIAIAHNFYGRAALSDDGRSLYVVEKSGIHSGLVRVDIDSGERSVMMVEAIPRRISFPLPSPDGESVALWSRYEGHSRGLLVLLGEGMCSFSRARSAVWVELPSTGGGAPKTFLGLVTERDGLRGVELIDPTTCESAGPITWDLSVDRIVGVWQSSLLVTFQRSCDVGLFDVANGEVTSRSYSPMCFERPVITPEGLLFDVAELSHEDDPHRGDVELIRVDLDSGKLTILTANGLDEQGPIVSRDGDRVVFAQPLETLFEPLPYMVTSTLALSP